MLTQSKLTSNLLRDIGECLYGARWQCELSRDLAVNERTVRRWLDGSRSIPGDLPAKLRALVKARCGALDKAMMRLR